MNNEANIYNFLKPDTLSEDIIATQEITKTHIIKKGENLSAIANKYHCSVSDIKTWNGISSNNIRAGRKLIIYTRIKKTPEKKLVTASKPDSTVSTAQAENTANKESSKDLKYYTVKKGDSLYKISQKYNTTVDEIKRLNNFGVNYNLLPGKIIQVSAL